MSATCLILENLRITLPPDNPAEGSGWSSSSTFRWNKQKVVIFQNLQFANDIDAFSFSFTGQEKVIFKNVTFRDLQLKNVESLFTMTDVREVELVNVRFDNISVLDSCGGSQSHNVSIFRFSSVFSFALHDVKMTSSRVQPERFTLLNVTNSSQGTISGLNFSHNCMGGVHKQLRIVQFVDVQRANLTNLTIADTLFEGQAAKNDQHYFIYVNLTLELQVRAASFMRNQRVSLLFSAQNLIDALGSQTITRNTRIRLQDVVAGNNAELTQPLIYAANDHFFLGDALLTKN